MAKKRKKKGLGAVAAAARPAKKAGISSKSIADECVPILLTAAGLAGASIAGGMIDKMLKASEGSTVKKLVRPIVLTVGGAAIKLFVADKHVKSVADGVAIAGILSGIKVLTKKDLLAGIEEDDIQGLDGKSQKRRFPTPISIEHPPYTPDLPALEAASIDEDMSGVEEEIAGDDDAMPALPYRPMAGDEAATVDLSGDDVEFL